MLARNVAEREQSWLWSQLEMRTGEKGKLPSGTLVSAQTLKICEELREGTYRRKQKGSINRLNWWLQDPGTDCNTERFPLQCEAILSRKAIRSRLSNWRAMTKQSLWISSSDIIRGGWSVSGVEIFKYSEFTQCSNFLNKDTLRFEFSSCSGLMISSWSFQVLKCKWIMIIRWSSKSG